jgi:glycosyltransferase involved in cell wall biosynthesis
MVQWHPLMKGRRFLWLAVPPWDGVWTRQNHFALRFARLGAEVLYVEQPRSIYRAIQQGEWFAALSRPRIRRVEPNLEVLTLPAVIPGALRSDLIADIVGMQVGRIVSSEIQKRGWDTYICWNRIPLSAHILPHLCPAPEHIIYDITDNYSAYAPRLRQRIDRRESRLLSCADLVLATSERLIPSRSKINPNIHYVPNGVDFELFASVGNPDMPPHPTVVAMPKPVIGFVGYVADWVNLDIVEALGKRWPGHVIMVGPIKPSLRDKIRRIQGVQWTGFIEDRGDLPRYIQGMDVCLIPFYVNALTMDMNPLKIWEYFATGKPIVSVDLPTLEPFSDLVDIAFNVEDFVAKVEARLKQGEDPERAAKRRRIAANFSWDRLFEQITKLLQPLIERT